MNQNALWRLLTLVDYNTRVVMFGTVALGIAGGVIGVFLLLRKRSLLVDAVSHAALPGVAMAFIIAVGIGGSGRDLPVLMLGALISGLLGMGSVMLITKVTRLSQDTALGIVLSVFFGFGTALLGIIQKMRGVQASGLNSFIYGKTASMLAADALFMGIAAIVVIAISLLLFKEFRLFTFDQDFAAGDGWPIGLLDLLLMSLVVVVTVLGLQAVGIILIIAILIIPPAAARFWTDRLDLTVLVSALVGAIGSYLGTAISAMAPRLPAGAVIVAVLGTIFVISLLFGSSRGLFHELIAHYSLSRQTMVQNVLRCLFENRELESVRAVDQVAALVRTRSWSTRELSAALKNLEKRRLVYRVGSSAYILSEPGLLEARRITRNHRLWEVYLLEYADVARSNVDYSADMIEHVLGEELVHELEAMIPAFRQTVPTSIHEADAAGAQS